MRKKREGKSKKRRNGKNAGKGEIYTWRLYKTTKSWLARNGINRDNLIVVFTARSRLKSAFSDFGRG